MASSAFAPPLASASTSVRIVRTELTELSQISVCTSSSSRPATLGRRRRSARHTPRVQPSVFLGDRQWSLARTPVSTIPDAAVPLTVCGSLPDAVEVESPGPSPKDASKALDIFEDIPIYSPPALPPNCFVRAADITDSFDNFPYYISPASKDALLNTATIFLVRPEFSRFVNEIPSMGRQICLNGLTGTELYQEQIARALAGHFNANFLLFDLSMCGLMDETRGAARRNTAPARRVFMSVSSKDGLSLTQDQVDLDSDSDSESDPEEDAGMPVLKNEWLRRMVGSALKDKGEEALITPSTPPKSGLFPLSEAADVRPIRKGDRVKYVGNGIWHRQNGSLVQVGPRPGFLGRVDTIFESQDVPTARVRFDRFLRGGSDHDAKAYTVKLSDLELSKADDAQQDLFDLFIGTAVDEGNQPCVVFIPEIDKATKDPKLARRLTKELRMLDGRLVIIASRTVSQEQMDYLRALDRTSKPPPEPEPLTEPIKVEDVFNTSLFSNLVARMSGLRPEVFKIFPNRVFLPAPTDHAERKAWETQLECDAEALKFRTNVKAIEALMARNQIECNVQAAEPLHKEVFSKATVERIVGTAVSMASQADTLPLSQKLYLSPHLLSRAVELVVSYSSDSASASKKPVLLKSDNQYEQQILENVIGPTDLDVSFEDIGALNHVKQRLKDLVMLPLQRPELFTRGNLTRPCKGILLFGPPGTGKTMLAKALATEAGASFLNISSATIASKWYGDSDKLVEAIFSVATRIAPCIIFVDEVDSLLTERSSLDHEATRRVKNEFMALWDGLKTKSSERVTVLGATNRPFDLDDAVLRRFPRRFLVDLPDESNRLKILKVILAGECLSPDLDLASVASVTAGYSGSDLKNLCVAAAFQPIRELLDQEEKLQPGRSQSQTPHDLRPLILDDFLRAKHEVAASVSEDQSSITALREWNERFGDGASRTKKKQFGFVLNDSD